MPSEYGGDDYLPNSVQGRGPDQARKLSSSEQLRLSNLTGQTEDTVAPAKGPAFFQGVDPEFPGELDGYFDLDLLAQLEEGNP